MPSGRSLLLVAGACLVLFACGSVGSSFDLVSPDGSLVDVVPADAGRGTDSAAANDVATSQESSPGLDAPEDSSPSVDSPPDSSGDASADAGDGSFADTALPPDTSTGIGDAASDSDAPADAGSFAVGGNVAGLAMGVSVVLVINGSTRLTVTGDGAFSFPTDVPAGSSYTVTVAEQPANPTQTCTVANGMGVVGTSNVTSITVTCVTSSFAVGGTLTGLSPGAMVVLQDNGGDALTLGANGAFTFPTAVPSGDAYAVTILTQPGDGGETCTVSAGRGDVGGAPVTTVVVNCAQGAFVIGGSVTGLAAGGTVALQDNGTDDLFITSNGPFAFPMTVVGGSPYAVTVLANPGEPVPQTCTVAMGGGTVMGTVSNVLVTCVTIGFPVGGTLSGLATSESVVLEDNGGDDLTVSANGSFTFTTPIVQGAPYAVTVLTNPPGEVCTVTSGSGTASGPVMSVGVSCVGGSFTVGGTVEGLSTGDSVVLQDNGASNLTITTSGPFTFMPPLPNGSPYDVTVLTQPAAGPCTVSAGTGTVNGANVTNVLVNCTLMGSSGTCNSGQTCQFECPGGSCIQQCNSGATCTFGCPGGSCIFACATGSSCMTSCPGGSCLSVPTCSPDTMGPVCLTCGGGNCTESCTGTESCAETCPGGGCTLTCTGSSVCQQGCPGGNCTSICSGGAKCTQVCPGGGCTIQDAGSGPG